MDVIHQRAAGLDVHKETIVACVRIMVDARVSRECRTFDTTTAGLRGCLETPARVLNLGKSVESKRSPIAGAFDVDCRDPGRA
jgi:hypothetical protein